MDETRLADKTYNWGYDPKNYNVPEGSYSTDPANPVTRIREFKEMVKSLHQNGMRIVLDVVYRPGLLLPPECRRFLLGRLGLRQ